MHSTCNTKYEINMTSERGRNFSNMLSAKKKPMNQSQQTAREFGNTHTQRTRILIDFVTVSTGVLLVPVGDAPHKRWYKCGLGMCSLNGLTHAEKKGPNQWKEHKICDALQGEWARVGGVAWNRIFLLRWLNVYNGKCRKICVTEGRRESKTNCNTSHIWHAFCKRSNIEGNHNVRRQAQP